MSRMFKSIDKTWNVFVGCRFDCSYCNAKKAAETRFKHLERYQNGFLPHLVEKELTKSFKPGEFIFVAYMGDIAFALQYEIEQILARIKCFPDTSFLLQTKNPGCFHRWELAIPPNVFLGTTIETNRDYHLTKAPAPVHRFRELGTYIPLNRFLSIEPIMDFDLDELTSWAKLLHPEIIEVGADNYHNNLSEPSPEKLQSLLANLRGFCPKVVEKDGLERLQKRR